MADLEQAGTATEKNAAGYHVAGRRIVAGLIDTILLFLLFIALAAAFGGVSTEDGTLEASLDNAAFALFILLALAYYAAAETLTGRTAGKAVMGLRVVRADGEPLGPVDAVARNLLRVADGFPYPFYIVAIVAMAVTRRRQRLGDLAARTFVVRA
jgi:uncharacterized RDD family membrane protein YckC